MQMQWHIRMEQNVVLEIVTMIKFASNQNHENIFRQKVLHLQFIKKQSLKTNKIEVGCSRDNIILRNRDKKLYLRYHIKMYYVTSSV